MANEIRVRHSICQRKEKKNANGSNKAAGKVRASEDLHVKLTPIDIRRHLAYGDFARMNNLMSLLLCKMINQWLV